MNADFMNDDKRAVDELVADVREEVERLLIGTQMLRDGSLRKMTQRGKSWQRSPIPSKLTG